MRSNIFPVVFSIHRGLYDDASSFSLPGFWDKHQPLTLPTYGEGSLGETHVVQLREYTRVVFHQCVQCSIGNAVGARGFFDFGFP